MYKLLFPGESTFQLKYREYDKDGERLTFMFQTVHSHPEEMRPAQKCTFEVEIQDDEAVAVEFAWHYHAKDDLMVVLDDITISAPTSKYTLTYIAGEGGEVNGTPKVQLTKSVGEEGPSVEAQPKAGWHFLGWSDGCQDNPRKDSRNTFAYARFSQTPPEEGPSSFTLIYRAGDNGRIQGFTWLPNIPRGGEGTPVVAIPDAGYRFLKWSDENTDNPRVDRNVMADVDVTAIFEVETLYTVTFAETTGGTISVSKSGVALKSGQKVPKGSEIEITATPDEAAGYSLVSLKVNGKNFVSGETHTVTENVEIVATFGKEGILVEGSTFAVRVSPNPCATVLRVESELPVLRCALHTLEGRVVAEDIVNASEWTIDMGHLPAGIYLLRCESEAGVQVVRIVKV